MPAWNWSRAVGGNQSNAEIQFYIQGPDLDQLAEVLRRPDRRK